MDDAGSGTCDGGAGLVRGRVPAGSHDLGL
jgi:hypothetical protein